MTTSTYVSSGQTTSGDNIFSGYAEVVFSGGKTINADVYGGVELLSGGTTVGTVVFEGGEENVVTGVTSASNVYGSENLFGPGAVASGTSLSYFGQMNVDGGGKASASIIGYEGEESVGSGATDTSSTVTSGGYLEVYSGGVATNDVVSSGGHVIVYSGGSAVGTTVQSGGILEFNDAVISAGQSLSSVTLSAGDTETVLTGGVASSTFVHSGGYLYVSGGVTSGTEVSSVGNEYLYGGTAVGTTLSGAGAKQIIYSGTASGTNISNSGFQWVKSGGKSVSATVTGSGTVEEVFAGGSATSSTVISGGIDIVGGFVSATTIGNNGEEEVESGATATSSTILSGGVQTVAVGATAYGTIVDSGGYMEVDGNATGTIVNSGGELDVFAGLPVSTTLMSGGTIDFFNLAYASGATATLNTTTDVLTIVEGGASTPMQLAGTYTNESFSVTPDYGGGTDLSIAGNRIIGTTAGQMTVSEASVEPFYDTIVQDRNAGATDTLTITLSGTGGILTGNGLSGGTNGVYTLAGTAASITQSLQNLVFTPNAGQPNSSNTTTFTLSDYSSVGTTVTDATTTVINKDPGVAPTISGAVAGQGTTSEAAVQPFKSVVIGDSNSGSTDTLTITLTGAGGTLTGNGLSGGTGGVYTLTGTGAAITTALQAVTFTPTAGLTGTANTTTFALSDVSTADTGASVANSATTVIDTDPAKPPTISGTTASQPTSSEAVVDPFKGVSVADPNSNATDTLTITVSSSGGTLTGSGLTGGTNGIYFLSGSAATVTTELDALAFKPAVGTPGAATTTTLTLSDLSSGYATPTINSTTTVIDTDPPKAPTITGVQTVVQTTTSEAPIDPFSTVVIGDVNGGATDKLTITESGNPGSLTGTGLTATPSGYTLTGTASAITAELQGLVFKPSPGLPNSNDVTTFKLTDLSSATPTTVSNSATSVKDTDPPAAPIITGTVTGQNTVAETPLAPFSNVSINDQNLGSPTDVLTINLAGGGGTLADGSGYSGLHMTAPDTYQLSGSSSAISAELDALEFTPHAGPSNTSTTTTFTLSDVSSVSSAVATDTATSVIDTPAQSVTINFATLSAGTPVATLYSNEGVSFSLQYTNGSTGTPEIGDYRFPGGLSNSATGDYPTAEYLDVRFSSPASHVSFTFDNDGSGTGSSYVAYSSSGAVVASGSLDTAATDHSFGSITINASDVSTIVLSNNQTNGNWEFDLGQISYDIAASTSHAMDGYIAGATVGYDNGSGAIDPNQPTTTTAADGSFVLTGGSGPIVLTGGTDTATGLPFTGTLDAPAGSTVVSALTTLVEQVASTIGDSALANEIVVQSLGLTPGTDLMTLDVVAGTQAGNAAATAAFTVGSQLQDIVSMISAAGGNPDSALSSIAYTIENDDPVNLSNQTTITNMGTSAGLDAAAATSIANIASSTESALAAQLASAPNASAIFNDVTGASIAQQGNAVAALTAAHNANNDNAYSSASSTYTANLTTTLSTDDTTAENNAAPCYCRGTRIRTVRGDKIVEDKAVENLAIGDQVLTAAGERRVVRWLGSRRLDCTRYTTPEVVWPIRIRAGAFAAGIPVRDLCVSPGHSLLIEGVLIQARRLVNGVTVIQEPRARVEYWHVELDSHDIIIAEALPAESYLDTGNRTAFTNGGAFLESRPDFAPRHWSNTCIPLVFDGEPLARAKSQLLARVPRLGYEMTDDAEVHVLADGKRIGPIRLGERRLRFIVPAEHTSIQLLSRTFIPAHTQAASQDARELGICVGYLGIDGVEVALDDEANMSRDWHQLEVRSDGRRHRWTRGSVSLPPGTRRVEIDVAGRGCYWAMRPKAIAAVHGG